MRADKEKDLAVLDFISEFTLKNGHPPTIRELYTGLGLKSTGSIYVRLMRLERDGFITWKHYASRTLRVVDHDSI